MLEHRLSETLTGPKERSGEGVLLTLLARLTLGVVVEEVTAGLSNRRTASLYPVSNLPCKVVLREFLPFENSRLKISYRSKALSLVPKTKNAADSPSISE